MVGTQSIVTARSGKAGSAGLGSARGRTRPPLIDDKIARAVTEAVGPIEAEKAKHLCRTVAQARSWYIANLRPSFDGLAAAAAERKLAVLRRALERGDGSATARRVLADHGAQWLLRWASGEATRGPEGDDQHAAERMIREGRYAEVLPIVVAAEAEGRARKGPPMVLQKPAQVEADRAVMMLDRAYRCATGREPARGFGRGGPSRFERFLEAALGDLARVGGATLGKRWQRLRAEPKNGSGHAP